MDDIIASMTPEQKQAVAALIDLHNECNAELRARIAELEAESGRLAQYLKDTCEGMECLPECDSYGHEDACPVANPEHAWRMLRKEVEAIKVQNAELEAERSELVKDRESLIGDKEWAWREGYQAGQSDGKQGYWSDDERWLKSETRQAIDAARKGSDDHTFNS